MLSGTGGQDTRSIQELETRWSFAIAAGFWCEFGVVSGELDMAKTPAKNICLCRSLDRTLLRSFGGIFASAFSSGVKCESASATSQFASWSLSCAANCLKRASSSFSICLNLRGLYLIKMLHYFTAGTTRRVHVWQLQPRHAAKVKAVNLTNVDGLAGEKTLAAHLSTRRN